jgi:hypothetical protein
MTALIHAATGHIDESGAILAVLKLLSEQVRL